MLSALHAAAELMQLREAEVFGASITITVAFGTSIPTSTTEVATRTSMLVTEGAHDRALLVFELSM